MAKYMGAEPILYKQMGDILTKKFNFPVSYHQQYRVVIKCKGYKDAQEIAKKYNIPSGSFISGSASLTGNENEIKALQDTDIIISSLQSDQIVTIEQLQAAIKEELKSQMDSVPLLLENMEQLIRNFIIIRDPKFEEYYKDIFWQQQCGKDLFELFEEYKQAAESDPDFDKYKIIALVRCVDDLRLSPDKSTGSGRGGARPGAGRKKGKPVKPKSELKKSRSIRMTDEEYPQVVEYLKQLRKSKEVSDEQK